MRICVNSQVMRMTVELEATVSHIEYNPLMCTNLTGYTMEDIASGDALEKGRFIIKTGAGKTAVSRWVTPKRTRSYPYARVYDTLNYPNRVTIIPLVKDEGQDGDRDYLQWDTVSLMSLLNVYVIPAYYDSAEKNPDYKNKITNQKLDTEYIYKKLEQLKNYQGDALHWNMREMEKLNQIAEKAKNRYYEKISEKTGVELSSLSAFERKMEKISNDVEQFKEESRKVSEQAQSNETSIEQASENVLYEKGSVTIQNFLGGKYYFTVDEVVKIDNNTVVLIEKKHSKSSKLPSVSDIKDGLLKLALYSNIEKVTDGSEKQYNVVSGIGITSSNLYKTYTPFNQQIKNSEMKDLYQERLNNLFKEALENNFIAFAAPESVTSEQQNNLMANLIKR